MIVKKYRNGKTYRTTDPDYSERVTKKTYEAPTNPDRITKQVDRTSTPSRKTSPWKSGKKKGCGCGKK